MIRTSLTFVVLLLLPLAAATEQAAMSSASSISATTPDPYTQVSTSNFLTDFAARNSDGTVNAVIEIPAGTTGKWEVDKSDGKLRWEFKKGVPRIVKYLGYPGNYGMIPRTLLPEELGGDGDPLDVIVLGPAAERGSVVPVRIVGVLKLLDDGEQDDKLLAVQEGTALATAKNLTELQEMFPGVTSIVETWFAHYKGPGRMQSNGFADLDVATQILQAATQAFEQTYVPQP